MKKLLSILIVVLLSLPVVAQQGERFERIRAARIALITQRLNLTSKQAEAFWPVYNKYESERIAIRRSFKAKQKALTPDADEETSRKYIRENIDYQQQNLELRKKYKDQFLKVISAQQVAALFDAEREFKEMLLEQLRERR